MKITDLPIEIFDNIVSNIVCDKDFNSYRNLFMALYREYKFDTSVVKQKVLEVYVKDSLNIIYSHYVIKNSLHFMLDMVFHKDI